MGIKVNGKDLISRYSRGKPVERVYAGTKLVWENTSYKVLPYIVSKGKSWSDTGLYLDPSIHRVQGSFIVDDLSMVSYGSVYLLEGARNSAISGVTKCSTLIKKLSESEYQIRIDWGILSTSTVFDSNVYEVGKEYVFDFTPEYIEINGVRVERLAQSNGACSNSYYIGSMNDPAVIPAGYYPAGIRATKRTFSIYATGEIIGESLATYTKANSLFDFYDKTTESYLENKGTEPWTGAYEAWVYDMGRPLSYLTADGTVASITAWTPIFGDQWKVDYTTSDLSTVKVGAGCRTSANHSDQYIGLITSTFYAGYGGASKFGFLIDGSKPILDKRYVFKADKNNFYVNDTNINYPYNTQNDAPCPFALGTVNNNNVLDARRHIGDYFGLEVLSEEGAAKHNYIPFYNEVEVQDHLGNIYPVGKGVWLDLVTRKVAKNFGDWVIPTTPVNF